MSISKIRAALESRLATVKGTATGSTTNAAGYAIGTKTINLANAGSGIIYDGDVIKFAGDTNPYLVSTGDSNVSNGGSIVLASGLLAALPLSAKAITIQSLDTVWENTNYTPITGIPYQRVFLSLFPDNPTNCRLTRYRGIFYVRLMYMQGTGAKQITDRANMIIDSFSQGTTLIKDNVECQVQETPTFNTEGNDGDRFCGLISINFLTNLI